MLSFCQLLFIFKKPCLPFYNKDKIEKVSKLKRHHQLNKQRVLKTICPVSLLCCANLIFVDIWNFSKSSFKRTSPKAAYQASKCTCVRQLIAFMPNSQTNRNFIPFCVLLKPNSKCRAGELFCGTKTLHNLNSFEIDYIRITLF